MAKLVYGLQQSLDGYVDHTRLGGPPGPVLFRHFMDNVRSLDGIVYGRITYAIMQYWDEDQTHWGAAEHEYAAVWRSKPKWVISRTLKSVGSNATLFSDGIAAARDLKARYSGEINVAGPQTARSLGDAGLIDEYRLYYRPFVLGSGTPFFAGPRPTLRLVASDPVGEDAVRLSYVPA